MEDAQYHLLAEVEERHWWHCTLRRAVAEALARHAADRCLDLLDLGCGTGGLLRDLASGDGPGAHRVVGVDRSPLALAYTRQRGASELAGCSVEALPFAGESFDAAITIDVLSHQSITSEATALGEIARVLRRGGLLVVQLSAFEWLRGEHDWSVHQARRYTRRQVVEMLGDAGFLVHEARYRLVFLPPLMMINNLWAKLRPSDQSEPDIALPSPAVNALLLAAARVDLRFGAWLPLGSSIFCVARRR